MMGNLSSIKGTGKPQLHGSVLGSVAFVPLRVILNGRLLFDALVSPSMPALSSFNCTAHQTGGQTSTSILYTSHYKSSESLRHSL